MKKFKVIFCILAIFFVVSCSDKIKKYYPSGEIKSIRNFNNGEKHGTATRYFENGIKKEKGNYGANNVCVCVCPTHP